MHKDNEVSVGEGLFDDLPPMTDEDYIRLDDMLRSWSGKGFKGLLDYAMDADKRRAKGDVCFDIQGIVRRSGSLRSSTVLWPVDGV